MNEIAQVYFGVGGVRRKSNYQAVQIALYDGAHADIQKPDNKVIGFKGTNYSQ